MYVCYDMYVCMYTSVTLQTQHTAFYEYSSGGPTIVSFHLNNFTFNLQILF